MVIEMERLYENVDCCNSTAHSNDLRGTTESHAPDVETSASFSIPITLWKNYVQMLKAAHLSVFVSGKDLPELVHSGCLVCFSFSANRGCCCQ